MFVYWILGAFLDDIETLTLAVGLLRYFESVGSCLAFGISAVKIKPMINLIIAFVMFSITIPSTFAAIYRASTSDRTALYFRVVDFLTTSRLDNETRTMKLELVDYPR